MTLPPERRALLVTFSATLLGAFLAGLGAQMVTTALPDIQAAVGASADEASWITTAYAMGEILMIPLAGMALQVLGMRRFMLTLCALFIVSAFGRMLITSLVAEILLGGVQGLLGGAFGVAAFGMTFRAFGGRDIAFGLMLLTFAQTFPASLGAVLSGWLTATDHGWTGIYWIEIGLALIIIVEILQATEQQCFDWRPLRATDWPGYLLVAPGLALLVMALSQGARRFWWDTPFIIWALALGLGLIAAFIIVEWRRKDGIVDFDLLSRRSFGAAVVINLCFRVSLLTASYVNPQVLAQLRGFRPLEFSQAAIITALAQAAAFPVTVALLRRWPPRRLIMAGFACLAAGPAALALIDQGWSVEQFRLSQLLLGVGPALVVLPLLVIGTRDVKPSEGASASTFFNGSRAVGQQLGTALIATLIRTREQFHSAILTEHVTPDRLAISGNGQGLGQLAALQRTQAFTLAYGDVFVLVAVVGACAVALTLLLPAVSRPGA